MDLDRIKELTGTVEFGKANAVLSTLLDELTQDLKMRFGLPDVEARRRAELLFLNAAVVRGMRLVNEWFKQK